MELIIDIGNTAVKLCAMDGDAVVECVRTSHDDVDGLRNFASSQGFSSGVCGTVITLSKCYLDALGGLGFPMMLIDPPTMGFPEINFRGCPETMGTDCVASLVAACHDWPDSAVMVVDVGTCVTYDVIDASHKLVGANIAPGPRLRMISMHEHTDRLPLVSLEGELPMMGYDTETAMRAGVLLGLKFEIEGYVRHFQKEYSGIKVYVTGGGALGLAFADDVPVLTDDYLVPRGLRLIGEMNRGRYIL